MNILVVSPHPDDETLGCGGTLLKHNKNKDKIYWLIITQPTKESGFEEEFINRRINEIEKVSSKYGMTEFFQLDYEPATLDIIEKKNLIGNISKIFNNIKPEIIYLPYRNDIHSDHKVVFDSIISCTKSFRYPYIKKVLAYETISETEFAPPLSNYAFQPNSFSDISEFLDEKIEIMNIYESEIGEHPFPRSERNIKALATFRGATAGVEYAEAFMVIKEFF
jgi:LmbE family N-acetylglucosaminyl deacetylase